MEINKIYHTDALSGMKQLKENSIDCIVTSPPYWALRDYKVKGQLGLEKDFHEYINKLIQIFTEAKRALKDTGTLWVNLADTYGGSHCGYGQKKDSLGFQNVNKQTYYPTSTRKPLAAKVLPKSMIGIPQRFCVAMIDSGWLLRNVIIWKKPNAMPESAKDRFTNDFEFLFFFSKTKDYFFQQQIEGFNSNERDIKRMKQVRVDYNGKWKNVKGIKFDRSAGTSIIAQDAEGRNKRCVWEITTKPFNGAHFAVFPEKLIETPIKAGCPKNGIVLDPFMGSGTTAVVAKKYHRNYIGFDLNKEFIKIANQRIHGVEANTDKSDSSNEELKHTTKNLKQKLLLYDY